MLMKNVVMVLLDGAREDRIKKLPNFSKLVKDSAYFSNIITYYPGTIASMYALFTGAYGRNNGVDNYWASPKFKADKYKVLPKYFQEHGYFTKGDIINDMIIPKIGFDELTIHDEFKDDLFASHKEMIEGIKNKAYGKKFFLYLHYSYIHTFTTINFIKKFESEFDERFYNQEERRKEYDSALKQADDYLGLILNTLSGGGLDNDTILIVLSDHGCGNGEKFGERRYGFFCYNYTLKTFMAIKGAGLPKKEYTKMARNIDILPTILELIGFNPDKNYNAIDGKSMMPVTKGWESDGRIAFSETAGSDGYALKEPRTKTTITAITTDEWKYMLNVVTGNKELYNLKEDPYEKINLAGKGLEIETRLHGELIIMLNKEVDTAIKADNIDLGGMKIKEYLMVNKKTFDALAGEYQGRWESSINHQKEYLSKFVHLLKRSNPSKKLHILDIGCGVGLDIHLLSKEGFKTTGLDFSEEMLNYAKINNPGSEFIYEDFLGFVPSTKYHGVILDAFIHLFPEEDCRQVLEKVKDLLEENGLCFLSTTNHDKAFEGYITKVDYNRGLKRYRKQWVKEDLKKFLEEIGYEIVLCYDDEQPHLDKKWMNFILKKNE